MKLWEAFATALLMMRRPQDEDHVGRVDAAMQRADAAQQGKAVAAAELVDADTRGREHIGRVARVIRWRHARQRAATPAVRLSTVREDIEAMLASLDAPRNTFKSPE